MERQSVDNSSKRESQTRDLTQAIADHSREIQQQSRALNIVIRSVSPTPSSSPQVTEDELFHALLTAVKDRDFGLIDMVVDTRPAVLSCVDDYGQTVLHKAARRGDVDMVRYLLAKGTNTWTKDSAGMIAKIIA